MSNWNTEKIINDLKSALKNIKTIDNQGQGGDVDTENIYISFKNTNDCLFICGFDDENDIVDPSNSEVPMVEVTDGLDSRGGLNSKDKKFAAHYIIARQYFIDEGFEVVDSIKAYF